MFRISISPKARNQLKSIKKRHQNALKLVIDDLKENPYLGKPLGRELTGKYSYRVGIYRIIYKINKKDKTVQILTAGHRSSVYN